MQNNVKDEWWRAMVRERDDIVGLDSAILMHPRVWEASGHLEGFTDPMVDCRNCKKRFRADKLEDAQCGRKPSKHPGEFAECDLTDAAQVQPDVRDARRAGEDDGVDCLPAPRDGAGHLLNFKNVLQFARMKLPFGIAQIGKSFRNEINPRNFIFRSREFEQMEMEFFCPPDEAPSGTSTGSRSGCAGTRDLGIRTDNLRFARTTRTSSRTTPRRPPTSSTCSRWAGRSSRASRTAATST